jgi:hypothetical protein
MAVIPTVDKALYEEIVTRARRLAGEAEWLAENLSAAPATS